MSFSSGDVTKPTATLRFDKIRMLGVVDRVNVCSFMVVDVPKNFWKKKGRELKAVRMIYILHSGNPSKCFYQKKNMLCMEYIYYTFYKKGLIEAMLFEARSNLPNSWAIWVPQSIMAEDGRIEVVM